MQYPQEFIAKCKVVYPEWSELHKALERGSEIVGRYLDDARQDSIPVSEIRKATNLAELQAKAAVLEQKTALYAEWGELWDAQHRELD